ncbi:MAG: hypothetical protein J6J52_00935 [Oscillospiraceae bacterium]|nr:hypothetical protein [Oscillospiraceae bacterium]
MRKKKFGIIRKRILSLLLATMMVSSSAVTVFATDDLSFSDGATTEITEQTPEETDVPEVTPEETDVTEETPEETDVTEETPEETDVTEETPDETDVTEETPEETDVTEETPEETDVTEEIPEETDVTEETPVEEPSEEGILIEHYISDVEGEGLLPYEYFVMEYVGTESDDGNSTYAESSRYFSSYSSSKSEYSSTVGYNSLTTAQKEAYDELYNIACTIDESASYDAEYVEKYSGYYFPELDCSIPVEDIDSDSLFKVYVALKNDNPQFFWMGHSYISWATDTHIVGFQFALDDGSIDYRYGDDRMQVKEELFEEVESVIEKAEAYGNDYSKEWYIHNYICQKTEYIEADHAHDISGVLIDGEAVCESYAKTFQLFMNALDIDVMYITGVGNGGGHAWNQIGLENSNGVTEWYNVDVTWDDEDVGYSYNYFNVVDSDGTSYDFTNGFVSNGKRYNEHTPKKSGDREYVYSAKKCTSTTYAYKNHAKNFKLASNEPVAKVGETEYTSLEDAFDATTEGDTVTLLSDASYNGFDMPEHSVILDCAGYTIYLDKPMDMNGDLTIKNVGGKTIDELGGAYKITNVDFEYIYINDNTLSLMGTWSDYLPAFISGYDNNGNEVGTLVVDLENDNRCGILEAVGMAEFVIADNEYVDTAYEFIAVEVVIGENSVLSTAYGWGEIIDLTVSDTSWLCVSTDDESPFFIIYNEITGDVLNVKAANMEEGLATVITRLKYPVEKFNFVYITDEGEEDYYVTRINSEAGHYLYGPFPTADFTVSDGENSVKRCTFSEALEYIEEQNSSSTKYTITYEGEEELVIENDVTFSNAKSVTLAGNLITFNGNITLGTDLVFEAGTILKGDLSGEGKTVTFASGDVKSEIYCPNINGVNITVDNCEVIFKDKKAVAENVISIPTFKLKGNTDIRFEGIDKISITTLDTNGDGNTMHFNKGKVEIKDIYYRGLTTFSIGSGEVLTLTGNILIYNSKKIIIHSESATRNDKIMNIASDLSNYFTTDMTNSSGVPFSVVYRDKTLVYDVPVYRLEGVGIFSEWSDILAYINKNGTSETGYDITLLCDAEIEKLTLPAATKAKSVTFYGEYILTLGNTTLSVPIDTYFGCDLVAENTAITVSAGKMLAVNAGAVKSITGTRTSALVAGTLNALNVKTFDTVDTTEEIYIEGDMTGINNFSGTLELVDSGSNVNITNIASDSLFSYNTGDELPVVTVNGISEDATLTINVNNGAPLASGTVILKSTSDIADEDYEGGSIVIENNGVNGEELRPYFYASSKAIKAECPDAITLSYGDKEKALPNIDKAFEVINANEDKTVDYIIQFNSPVEFDKLTIPTYANSIDFTGEQMTFTGTSLKLPVTTTFACDLMAENTAITASKDVYISDATVKSITGTRNSKLVAGKLIADSVKTFATVSGDIDVTSSMAVTGFAGHVKVNTPKTTVSIANVTEPSGITLVSDETGKFGKVTITDIAEDVTATVSVVDAEGNAVALESGTIVLYTAGKDLSGAVNIFNKTSDEKLLTAFYYKNNKSIKAEWANAITLSYDDTNVNLPNIDKVFEVINANKNKTVDYTIQFNRPVEFDKLTIPTYANSITFTGSEMTFTGKTLKLPVTTTFACDLTAENTAITASKDVYISDATVKSITGTKNSSLKVEGTLDAQTVKTFANVDATEGKIVADTSVTITEFEGYMTAGPEATVTIKTIPVDAMYADIDLVSDENGKFGKLNLTNVNRMTEISVIDEEGEYVSLISNIPVAYAPSDISENIFISNTLLSLEEYHPAYYVKDKKAVYSGYQDAVTVHYVDAEGTNYEKNFTNLEEAIAYIPLDALLADIYLNRDVRVEEFSVPEYECGRLGFEGNGNRILLDGITSVSFKTVVVLDVITVDSTVPFTISTTDDILFTDFNSSTLTGVSGKSTKSIVYSGDSNNANYNISGFGTLDMASGPVVDVNKGLTVKNVLYASEGVLNILPDAELKLTNLNPQNENLIIPLTMVYYDGASPVKITGTVKGEVILEHQNKFTSGEQLLVASKADLSNFTLNADSFPDEKEYILTRKSGKVYIKPVVFEVSDGTTGYKYAEWYDFAAMVNEEKTPETDYVVNVLDDYNAGESISMPRAGYYSSIKLVSADETPDTFTFRSGIKQTGNLIIDNINLCSVNAKGVETAYAFTVGKYSLTATDVDFGKVSALTASGDSVVSLENCYIDGKLTVADAALSDVTVTGAVKATKTLTLNGTATFGNTVNVYGFSGEGSVVLTNGKLLTVGKGGSGEDTITITLKTPITAKTKVGTVPLGYYNDNFVGENVDIVVEGTTIYAYPKA